RHEDLTRPAEMARIMAIMTRRQPYTLVYARGVTRHLKSIDAKYDSLIRQKMDEQLLFEPNVETPNRKPLRQPAPFAAQWEIRFWPQQSLPRSVRHRRGATRCADRGHRRERGHS